jgi:hypothetical protein
VTLHLGILRAFSSHSYLLLTLVLVETGEEKKEREELPAVGWYGTSQDLGLLLCPEFPMVLWFE